MSNIQNTTSAEVTATRHTVVNYISTAAAGQTITKAFTGQRLVTACYREDKKTGTNRTNRAASIPMLSITELDSKMSVLKPLLVTYLESVQDKLFKALLDANGTNGTVVDIAEVDINLDACIAALQDSDSSGNRLTKESIGLWFGDSGLEAQLSLVLADKLGIGEVPTDAESKRVETICNEYKAKLAALAGGKTSYNENLALSLKKALSLVPDDKLAGKFNTKLDKMIAQARVKVDLFDLL